MQMALLRTLWSALIDAVYPTAPVRGGAARRRLILEALEDRSLPSATITLAAMGDSLVFIGLSFSGVRKRSYSWTIPLSALWRSFPWWTPRRYPRPAGAVAA